jgi:two-component system, OmpR family, sensor kinase
VQQAWDARALDLLEGLLALDAIGLDDAMVQAAQRLAGVLSADKVDVFFHDADADVLVAVGVNPSEMSRRQAELGLDVLPASGRGWTASTFRDGRSRMGGHLDREPDELAAIAEQLGAHSTIQVPLDVAGERRGVLVAYSATPEFFRERDLRLMEAVAGWVGLVAYRAARVELVVARAAEAGIAVAAEELSLLTRRQQEVASLIAGGLSNAEIAQRLVLTPGTVANHVEHILRRLDLRSRVQVATWAVERGLIAAREPSDS